MSQLSIAHSHILHSNIFPHVAFPPIPTYCIPTYSLMLHSNIFPQIMCLCILIMPKNHAVILKVLQVPLPNATIVHDIRGAVDLMVATNEEDIF